MLFSNNKDIFNVKSRMVVTGQGKPGDHICNKCKHNKLGPTRPVAHLVISP